MKDGLFESLVHFDGWDWTELASAWNLYIPDDYYGYGDQELNDFDPVKWYILSALRNYDGCESTRVMMKMAADCRKYLSILGNPDYSHGYSHPVWKGMSKIENDWTLLWFVYSNIGSMWD